MSDGHFLSRWSRLKREEARRVDNVAPPLPSDATPSDVAPSDPPSNESPLPDGAAASMPDLPALDDISALTDMSVFRHPAVPDALRQAALRKLWAVDPEIRDFISPAVDYAWDWNTPGGVPGNGVLGRLDDVTRMLSQVVDGFDRPEPLAAEPEAPQPTGPAPEVDAKAPDESPQEPAPAQIEPVVAQDMAGPDPGHLPDDAGASRTALADSLAVAPAGAGRRRHGGALPV